LETLARAYLAGVCRCHVDKRIYLFGHELSLGWERNVRLPNMR